MLCYTQTRKQHPNKGETKGEDMIMNEEWVTMSDAAFQLKVEGFNVSVSKLSRLAKQGTIQSAEDPLDQRIKLVELNELRTLFGSSKRVRK